MASAVPRIETDQESEEGDRWGDEEPPDAPLLGAELIGGEDGFPPAYILSAEESRRQYELAVRKYMGMSAEEFLRRWDAGEWHEQFDDGEHWWIGHLIGLRPFAQEE